MNRKRGARPERYIIYILFLFLAISAASAHGGEEEETTAPGQPFYTDATYLNSLTMKVLAIAAAIAIVFVVIAINYEQQIQQFKKPIFLAIIIPLILASLFLVGTTLYTNIASMTRGPVHWHADYEVWACGQKLDLVDPKGMSNRIGTSTFHEHGDDRIHVEGVVYRLQDVSLGKYVKTIGGELSKDHLSYPTEQGVMAYHTGDKCPDNKQGILKVYVNGKKKENYSHYVITPVAYVPPGDCIIIDFSPGDSETTDKICSSWKAKGWAYK